MSVNDASFKYGANTVDLSWDGTDLVFETKRGPAELFLGNVAVRCKYKRASDGVEWDISPSDKFTIIVTSACDSTYALAFDKSMETKLKTQFVDLVASDSILTFDPMSVFTHKGKDKVTTDEAYFKANCAITDCKWALSAATPAYLISLAKHPFTLSIDPSKVPDTTMDTTLKDVKI